jgi:hypothetical protein
MPERGHVQAGHPPGPERLDDDVPAVTRLRNFSKFFIYTIALEQFLLLGDGEEETT